MSATSENGPRTPRFWERILFLGPHTCPWWFGYTFDNPVRRLIHDPEVILGPFVRPGQTVVDIGCGLGYFSIGLARLVGPDGRVTAIDVQPQMLRGARRRAERLGMADRIDFRSCRPDHLGLTNSADFVLAFWMIHEVEDKAALFDEVRSFLSPNGTFLVVEPKIHVPASHFASTVGTITSSGFLVSEGPSIRFSRCVACTKPAPIQVVDADTEARLVVLSAEIAKTNKPDANPYLRVDFDIADYETAPDFSIFNTLPTGDPSEVKRDKSRRWRIRQVFEACNVDFSGQVDVSTLIGAECWAILGVSTDPKYGEQNYIKRFIMPQ